MVSQVAAGSEPAARRLELDLLIWLSVIAAAWMAAAWLEVSGTAHLLHHHTIYHSGRVVAGGLTLLLAWPVMTAAMMLPGALPAMRWIGRGSGGPAPAAKAELAFLATYLTAWTGFALVAFVADMGLHALVHGWPLLALHENLIPTLVLGAAAAYQLTPWKRAGLDACRRPETILARIRSGGARSAVLAGIAYSRHCLASGWALMLIMFSVGVADLVWMVALALAMLAEKMMPSGRRLGHAVAGALALLAAGTLLRGQLPIP